MTDQDDLDEQAFQAQEDQERERVREDADRLWQEEIEPGEREQYVLDAVAKWEGDVGDRYEAFQARLAEQRDLQE